MRIAVIFTLLLATRSVSLVAAENEPFVLTEKNVAAFFDVSRDFYSKQLELAKRGRVTAKAKSKVVWQKEYNRYVFRSVQAKSAQIAELEEQIANPPIPTLLRDGAKDEGQIGTLAEPRTTYSVIQLIGDGAALVIARPSSYRNTSSDWTFLLKSGLAKGLQEGHELKCVPGVYRVGKRTQYTTVMGADKVVDVLTAYDVTPHRTAAK